MTQTTHNNELSTMFNNKKLIIGDYVMKEDIPKIYHYFDNFNIASIKDITYYDHPHDDCSVVNQLPFYGYVIIEVDEWHNNMGACNFYNNILENKCKMVYNDPYYWDLEFYNDVLNNVNVNVNVNLNNEVENDNEEEISEEENVGEEVDVVDDNNMSSDVSSNSEVLEHDEFKDVYGESEEEEDDDDEEVESEVDDFTKDPNYDLVESENEDDYPYEYLIPTIKKMKNEIYTRSKAKAKAKFEELKAENEELKQLLVKNNKNNKNYLKNDKRKSYKNDWTRRLRRKVEVNVF